MGIILNIETATDICSVSVSSKGKLLAIRETDEPNSHSLLLATMIKQILHEGNIASEQLNAVAVSSGPGSYTGLRIGVSLAKGLCYSLDIPLIAISTLESMANGIAEKNTDAQYFIPMIDAGRMEVYSAVFEKNMKLLEKPSPTIIDTNSFSKYFSMGKVAVFGNGAQKCKSVLNHSNAIYPNSGLPSAESMVSVAENYYNMKKFVDTAYFEPVYLKEFQAKISKVKGLD